MANKLSDDIRGYMRSIQEGADNKKYLSFHEFLDQFRRLLSDCDRIESESVIGEERADLRQEFINLMRSVDERTHAVRKAAEQSVGALEVGSFAVISGDPGIIMGPTRDKVPKVRLKLFTGDTIVVVAKHAKKYSDLSPEELEQFEHGKAFGEEIARVRTDKQTLHRFLQSHFYDKNMSAAFERADQELRRVDPTINWKKKIIARAGLAMETHTGILKTLRSAHKVTQSSVMRGLRTAEEGMAEVAHAVWKDVIEEVKEELFRLHKSAAATHENGRR